MKHSNRYIQWQQSTSNSMDEKVAEIMKHWQKRYELGSAVLLSQSPATAQKSVVKQWSKLTRQLQKVRSGHQTAEELLNTTRAISRMQRVRFTTKSPQDDPDATFYILSPDNLTSLPTRCYTIYSVGEIKDDRIISALAPEALMVIYAPKRSLPQLKSKTILEEQFITEQTEFESWLEHHDITLLELSSNLEKSNQALDTLLGSSNLQAEFLHKASLLLHSLQLAQPMSLSEELDQKIANLQQLQRHVQLLSSTYLSDHVIDSASDDSFLLRDISTGWALTLDSLRAFITEQYSAGRHNLARALEQKAGFSLLH